MVLEVLCFPPKDMIEEILQMREFMVTISGRADVDVDTDEDASSNIVHHFGRYQVYLLDGWNMESIRGGHSVEEF